MHFLCQTPEAFLKKNMSYSKCSFSVILMLNVRLYNVDPLCFTAYRGSYGLSADLFLHKIM